MFQRNKPSDVLESASNDYYIVYTVLEVPKPHETAIINGSFKIYCTEEFAIDMSLVPPTHVYLSQPVEEKLEALSDLSITCLDSLVPIKTVRVGYKTTPL